MGAAEGGPSARKSDANGIVETSHDPRHPNPRRGSLTRCCFDSYSYARNASISRSASGTSSVRRSRSVSTTMLGVPLTYGTERESLRFLYLDCARGRRKLSRGHDRNLESSRRPAKRFDLLLDLGAGTRPLYFVTPTQGRRHTAAFAWENWRATIYPASENDRIESPRISPRVRNLEDAS